MKIDDEICQCGHSKGYHKATRLDPHGGNCEKCGCNLYTWKAFVQYANPKESLAKSDERRGN
jgi:hypothetical protein